MTVAGPTKYGPGQIAGAVIACVGFGLCLACCVAPYWIKATVTGEDARSLTENVAPNDTRNFTIGVGVWWFCVTLDRGDYCLSTYDPTKYEPWINIVRGAVVVNVVLAFLGALVSCCRCACSPGRKTICFGLLSLFGGIFGFAAAVIFYVSSDDQSLLDIPLQDCKFGLPYVFYILGSVFMVVASVLLCFAQERDIEKIDP